MNQNQLEAQELDRELELYEALLRLRKNPDYKLLIEDTYLNSNALDKVSLLGVPQIVQQGKRTAVMEELVAISNLKYFLLMVEQFGEAAKDTKLELENEEMV